MGRRSAVTAAATLSAALIAGGLAGCATPLPAAASDGVLQVAASIDVWGSVLAQLGGAHVHATSIITSPATDPHDYEPTPADARTVADARLFVENGVGYDPWAAQAVAADPDRSRRVLDVGELVHVPAGGNPHRWYSPADVTAVADAVTTDLAELDPQHAGYFRQRRAAFAAGGLGAYHRLIGGIRSRYAGTAVGASESVVAPLAGALGLDLVTPAAFLRAVSEGTDPSPRDVATASAQISGRRIAVYLWNSQNSTPDVAAQVAAARARGIPVVAVTETLTPATATFQQWQTAQLQRLADALRTATGR